MLQQGEIYRAFTLANSIAQSTGRFSGVEMSLNFPAGVEMPKDVSLMGESNISITIEKGRKRFEGVTADEVKKQASHIAEGVRFQAAEHGYDGFHVITTGGRMTVMPGAIHVWLPIDKRVEEFLDWLFVNAYGLRSPAESVRYIK